MYPSSAPFDADDLVLAAIRQGVPEAKYVSPLTDASEPERLPAVVFDDFDGDNDYSYQDILGTTYWFSVHVAAETRREAKRLARKTWLALMRAPSLDLSLVDTDQRILAVFDGGAPVENRTQGQALSFYEFRFTVRVMVGRPIT